MNRRAIASIGISVFLFLKIGGVYGGTFQCGSCHTTPPKTLSALHKSFNIAEPASCFVCHKLGGKPKLLGDTMHITHGNKSAGKTIEGCLSCHVVEKEGLWSFPGRNYVTTTDRIKAMLPFYRSWTESSLLDNSHRQKGISCNGCHSDVPDKKKVIDTQTQCVECHGDFEKMSEKTSVKLKNNHDPHYSHYADTQCSSCHHGHRTFEDYCAQCHEFGFKRDR